MNKSFRPFIFLGIFLFTIMFLSFHNGLLAKTGVGIGTGKIQIDTKLKPGSIYELPSITIFNTGDEPSKYSVRITYHEQQPELSPPAIWFNFSPQDFDLDPGEFQEVKVTLNIPIRTEPGDYFAYVEGYPVKITEEGASSVGIAAAAKLYFTIVPGSVLEGIYYRLLSFYNLYAPWPQRTLIAFGVLAAALLFTKFFNIKIDMKSKNSKKPNQNKVTSIHDDSKGSENE